MNEASSAGESARAAGDFDGLRLSLSPRAGFERINPASTATLRVFEVTARASVFVDCELSQPAHARRISSPVMFTTGRVKV